MKWLLILLLSGCSILDDRNAQDANLKSTCIVETADIKMECRVEGTKTTDEGLSNTKVTLP